jgi:class 3 adenylate cyclase/tetratricopeptide (TPR) repeat protein
MPSTGIMIPGDAQEPADSLQAALLQSCQKVVLVLDLVESVRLMASDEVGTVSRWLEFTHHAEGEVIPAHQGRLVKSLGDGLMVEFDSARQAVAAAQDLHDAMARGNQGLPIARQMQLRAGIHQAQVYSGEHDIYGAGVNLTSRLAGLAQPGETVISADVRDELTDGLDASVEDLGDCYVKHVEEPVRAYRITPVGSPARPPEQPVQLRPTLAVIPFEARSNEPEHFAIGELVADAIIARLSGSEALQVISRLSTTVFRQRKVALGDMATALGANYVLSGSYVAPAGRLVLTAELALADGGHVVWSQRLVGPVDDLLQADSDLCRQIAEAAHRAVLDKECARTLTQPLPTLASYSLLLGGIGLMHRATARDFDRSRQVMELLIERHRKAASTRAWLAMWYVLKTTRGIATDPERDAAEALAQTQQALDSEPGNALALAMEGWVHCHMKKDPDTAGRRLDAALDANPNNALAWLFMTTVNCLRGRLTDARVSSEQAMRLSPLDPLRYYYLCLAGGAALFDGQWQRAAELLDQSWRLNKQHTSTLRGLVIANSILQRDALAKTYLTRLREMEPQLTVQRYLAQSPGGLHSRERFAHAMARVGLPTA